MNTPTRIPTYLFPVTTLSTTGPTTAGATGQSALPSWMEVGPLLDDQGTPPPPAIDSDDKFEPDRPKSFPVEALPKEVRQYVEAVAEIERVPAALPAACALGTISAAIGK